MQTNNKKKLRQKELMFCLSKWLPEVDTYALAKSMRTPDKWHLYKVSENPTAKHIQDREIFVVVRAYREGEMVRAGEGNFVDGNRLMGVQ